MANEHISVKIVVGKEFVSMANTELRVRHAREARSSTINVVMENKNLYVQHAMAVEYANITGDSIIAANAKAREQQKNVSITRSSLYATNVVVEVSVFTKKSKGCARSVEEVNIFVNI